MPHAARLRSQDQTWRQNGLHRIRVTWENGSCESFNARFRDALLIGEVFSTPRAAQILIERYRPPAPESIVTMERRPILP